MMDTQTQQKFAQIERFSKISRPDLFKCHFCWKTDSCLFIGWGDYVQMVSIKEKSKLEISTGLTRLECAIIHQ